MVAFANSQGVARLGRAGRGEAGRGEARRGKVKATGETQPPFFVGNQNIR